MPAPLLSEALEREHREIDAGIEDFVRQLASGTVDAQPVRRAMTALRRHIYLEEEFLFPQIGSGAVRMALMVMLREHGQLWRTLDELDQMLEQDSSAASLQKCCAVLLSDLDQHNSKEEPVIYPLADSELSSASIAGLTEFMASGELPEGWICARAEDDSG